MELDMHVQLAEARDRLDSGDPQGAFHALRWVFRDEGLATRRGDLVEVLKQLEPIARQIAGAEFAQAIKHCETSPDDPQALYDLAMAFMAQGISDVAACLLLRSRRLVPDEPGLLFALVDALEDEDRYRLAYDILKEDAPQHQASSYAQYLLAFHAVMCADLEGASTAAAGLCEFADDESRMMADRITAMLDRATEIRAVSDLGSQDLRGWHYVITGGLLLHLSRYGFDEAMNGRYAFTSDSFDRCREGLLRLQAALDACGVTPKRICYLPERGSKIMALAAGNILGVPVEEWEPNTSEVLVVAYDLGDLDGDTASALHEHRPGQLVFDHASCWTSRASWAADLTTYLYQQQSSPWGERLRVEDAQALRFPPDASEPGVLAQRIVEAEVEEGALNDLDQLRRFAAATGHAAALRQRGGHRSKLWSGPVTSSRFG